MDGRTDRQTASQRFKLQDPMYRGLLEPQPYLLDVGYVWFFFGEDNHEMKLLRWSTAHQQQQKNKATQKAYTLPQSLILARVHFEQPSLGVQLQSVRVPAIQRTSHIYCGRQQEELQLQWLRQHWLDASIRRTNNQTDSGLEDRHLVQQLCNSHKGFRKRNKNKRKRLC